MKKLFCLIVLIALTTTVQTSELCGTFSEEKLICHSDEVKQFLRTWGTGDIDTYLWQAKGCKLGFLNRDTGREINVVSDFPLTSLGNQYHVHPHPQFCAKDELVLYTTTVDGHHADVAICRTAELVAATG